MARCTEQYDGISGIICCAVKTRDLGGVPPLDEESWECDNNVCSVFYPLEDEEAPAEEGDLLDDWSDGIGDEAGLLL